LPFVARRSADSPVRSSHIFALASKAKICSTHNVTLINILESPANYVCSQAGPESLFGPARKRAQVPHGDSRFVALSARSRAPLRHFHAPIRVDSCEFVVFISLVKTVKTMKNEQRKYLKFQKVAGNFKNGSQKFEAMLCRENPPAGTRSGQIATSGLLFSFPWTLNAQPSTLNFP
jgi:hypothetical protein